MFPLPHSGLHLAIPIEDEFLDEQSPIRLGRNNIHNPDITPRIALRAFGPGEMAVTLNMYASFAYDLGSHMRTLADRALEDGDNSAVRREALRLVKEEA